MDLNWLERFNEEYIREVLEDISRFRDEFPKNASWERTFFSKEKVFKANIGTIVEFEEL